MIRRRNLAKVLTVGVTLGLVAAACGDDGGSSGGETTTTAAATTTAAGASTTAAASTTTAAASNYKINDANCPAEAKADLAAGAPIKLAFVAPQTGPLAGFGIIGQGMKVIFNKVNEAGGIDGHKIEFITKDDAYDPAKTKTAVQELLEKDKISASILQVGTPNVAAVRADFEKSCTPQPFVGTGFPAWGDPKNFQFTVGGILAYNTEAKMWIEYIKKLKPGAKVAALYYNNDFGKAYQKTFDADAKGAGLNVVASNLHEATSTLNNEVTALLAAGPDVIVGGTTAGFCGTLAKLARAGGFTGPIVVSATCFSTQFLGTPEVGAAGAKVFGMAYLKDINDQQWKNDPDVVQYFADVKKYNPEAKPEISSVATGYVFGTIMVDVLERAAKEGLSRVDIMNAVWNTNIPAVALGYPGGKVIVDGSKDAYTSEYAEVREFQPGSPPTFKSTGEIF
ncbi:MAG TPA: ABC transporter substrate-binding protein, partial [Acidimicrobiales bacterium]